ncbi:MAG: hypothetical protein ACUVTR_07545, partial [Dehalococcoidia bacterium]
VAVAQRTLDPLAQVRILARQPAKIKVKADGLNRLIGAFCHFERSRESRPLIAVVVARTEELDART